MKKEYTRASLVVDKEELSIFKSELKKEDLSLSKWFRDEMKKKILEKKK